MSHIHVPDGIIPFYIWIPGYLITFAIIFLIIKSLDTQHIKRILPYTGVSAALMLIGMSVPLFIVPVHLSLAVLIGILIGPKMGFLVVFSVSLILALFGHGGITIVGLNTLVIGSEVLIGGMLFRWIGKKSLVGGTVTACIIALVISMAMMISLVGLTAGFAEALPHHHNEHHHEEAEDHHGDDEHHHEDHHHDLEEAVGGMRYFIFTGWVALVLILVIGLALETTITVLMVKFLNKVKPDLFRLVHRF